MILSEMSSSEEILHHLQQASRICILNLRKKMYQAKNRMNWVDLFALWRLIESTNTDIMLQNGDGDIQWFQDNSNFGTQLELACMKLASETDMKGGPEFSHNTGTNVSQDIWCMLQPKTSKLEKKHLSLHNRYDSRYKA